MTPTDLALAGQKIYGRKKWKTQLANALGVNVATIYRMVHRSDVPGPYQIAINSLLANKKQMDDLEKAAKKLLPKGYHAWNKRKQKKRKKGERKLLPYAGSPELESE